VSGGRIVEMRDVFGMLRGKGCFERSGELRAAINCGSRGYAMASLIYWSMVRADTLETSKN
jgi:hypothetical protein